VTLWTKFLLYYTINADVAARFRFAMYIRAFVQVQRKVSRPFVHQPKTVFNKLAVSSKVFKINQHTILIVLKKESHQCTQFGLKDLSQLYYASFVARCSRVPRIKVTKIERRSNAAIKFEKLFNDQLVSCLIGHGCSVCQLAKNMLR